MSKKASLQLLSGYWWGFVTASIGFALTTLFILTHFARPLDLAFTTLVQAKVADRWDPVLSFFSLVANFEVLLILVTVSLLMAKKLRTWVTILAVFLFGHLIELAGKTFLVHPKPPLGLDRTHLNLHFPTHFISTVSSYPSGHSFRCVYIAVLVSWWLGQQQNQLGKKVGLGLVALWVGLTLISRVSLGQHWLSDVIGGSWLGLALAYLTLILLHHPTLIHFWRKLRAKLPFPD